MTHPETMSSLDEALVAARGKPAEALRELTPKLLESLVSELEGRAEQGAIPEGAARLAELLVRHGTEEQRGYGYVLGWVLQNAELGLNEERLRASERRVEVDPAHCRLRPEALMAAMVGEEGDAGSPLMEAELSMTFSEEEYAEEEGSQDSLLVRVTPKVGEPLPELVFGVELLLEQFLGDAEPARWAMEARDWWEVLEGKAWMRGAAVSPMRGRRPVAVRPALEVNLKYQRPMFDVALLAQGEKETLAVVCLRGLNAGPGYTLMAPLLKAVPLTRLLSDCCEIDPGF